MVYLRELPVEELDKILWRNLQHTVLQVKSRGEKQSTALAKRLKFFAHDYVDETVMPEDIKKGEYVKKFAKSTLSKHIRYAIKQFISSFPELYLNEDFEKVRNVLTRRIFGIPSPKKVNKGFGVGKIIRKIQEEEMEGVMFDQRLDIYKSLSEKLSPFRDELNTAFLGIVENLQKLETREYVMPQKTHPKEVVSEVKTYLSKIVRRLRFYESSVRDPDLAAKSGIFRRKNVAVEIKEFGPPKKTYNQILNYLKDYDVVVLACPNIPEIFEKEKVTKQEFIEYFEQDKKDLSETASDMTNTVKQTYNTLRELELTVPEECVLIACAEAIYQILPKLRYKRKEVESIIENASKMNFKSINAAPIGEGGKYKFVKINLK